MSVHLGGLASVQKTGQTTSYIYTADGDRLVRKEPGAITLYLPGNEVRLNTSTGAATGTRFWPIGNNATIVRSASGFQFQFADPHGTGGVAVNSVTGAVTHRRTDPFGNDRGTAPPPGVWVGEKGFVGGDKDTSTGLTQLGARLYDPVNGKFISVDPLIDTADPQQMNAYSYANNSPVTYTDPDGLMPKRGVDEGRAVSQPAPTTPGTNLGSRSEPVQQERSGTERFFRTFLGDLKDTVVGTQKMFGIATNAVSVAPATATPCWRPARNNCRSPRTWHCAAPSSR